MQKRELKGSKLADHPVAQQGKGLVLVVWPLWFGYSVIFYFFLNVIMHSPRMCSQEINKLDEMAEPNAK